MENEKLFEFMEKIYSELQETRSETQQGFKNINTKIENLEIEVKKNSIKLETIEKKIDIIAEVQTAHKDQSSMCFKNLDALTEEKTDLLGTAAKSISKDTRDIKESIDVMKDVIGRHQIDIEILKRRPV